MDPISSVVTLHDLAIKCKRGVQEVLDAVRGADNRRTVWYQLCAELAELCNPIAPVLTKLELQLSKLSQAQAGLSAVGGSAQDGLRIVLNQLCEALADGRQIIQQCRHASAARLYLSGAAMKQKFQKVRNHEMQYSSFQAGQR